jgi:STE24 endopeptidase
MSSFVRKLILFAATAAVTVAVTVIASAQTPPPAAPQQQPAATAASDRVAVPEPSEKALQYYRTGNALWAFSTLWGIVVPLVILFSGLSARMRDFAQRIGKKWFFVLAIYLTVYALLTFLIDLPLAYYAGYARPHAYGLSNQTLAKWAGDLGKGLLISLIATPLFMWVPFLLLRKSPRRWWFYSGLATIPFIVFVMLISPIWIDPLFNKFGPMKDKALEQRILDLADKAGISGSRVYEVNKSVDTKMVNAYVTGFGQTKRIVLWDTIIAKLTPEELLFVMGHEMGHYVLGHVAQIIVLASAMVMLGLLAVHLAARRAITRWGGKWGFTELSDFAALPLITVLFTVTTLVASPLLLAATRHNEHEADRFGLEITRANRAGATAFVKLQQENLAVPRPGLLFKLWRSSHPPIGERIDFINEYRPWEKGERLKYEEYFRRRQASNVQ